VRRIEMTKEWNYREEYNKLLDNLHEDTHPWHDMSTAPIDGTKIYIKCGVDYKGERLYDVGCWADYTKAWWWDGILEGEWCTEFGNCNELTGWKIACND
jgi:hypothetical protein